MHRKRWKLTARNVPQFSAPNNKARSKQFEYPDTEILGLRLVVTKTGRRSFLFRYTYRGRRRCITIGEYPAVSLESARKIALKFRATLQLDNRDPALEREASLATPTFEEFVTETYIPYAMTRLRSWKDSESRLRHHVLSVLGRLPMDEIRTRDIERIYHSLIDKVSSATASRVHASISAVFSLAVRMEIIERNPCSNVQKLPENPGRLRFLDESEVSRFMAACYKDGSVFAALFLFLLFTGLRRGEALKATLEDLDEENRLLYLPITKSGRSRTVHLSEEAVGVLTSIQRPTGNSYLFPGFKPGKPVSEPKFAFQRILESAEIPRSGVTLHTLRHTHASWIVNSGGSLYDVSQALGHHNQQTSSRYAHLSADRQFATAGNVAKAMSSATDNTNGERK